MEQEERCEETATGKNADSIATAETREMAYLWVFSAMVAVEFSTRLRGIGYPDRFLSGSKHQTRASEFELRSIYSSILENSSSYYLRPDTNIKFQIKRMVMGIDVHNFTFGDWRLSSDVMLRSLGRKAEKSLML